jgi:nucleotide-binding universal stress UspA family protein
VGSQRHNTLREWVFGTPAERFIRLCGRPVLVVKKVARSRYRRILVPVDLSTADGRSVSVAAALASSPFIEVFHSLSTKNEITMRAADVPESAMRRYRRRMIDLTRLRIGELIHAAAVPLVSATASVGFGSPSFMVLAKEQAMRADLIVIGKRRKSLFADFLLGSVTQRVLAESQSDVLVLPRWNQAQMNAPGLPVHQPRWLVP